MRPLAGWHPFRMLRFGRSSPRVRRSPVSRAREARFASQNSRRLPLTRLCAKMLTSAPPRPSRRAARWRSTEFSPFQNARSVARITTPRRGGRGGMHGERRRRRSADRRRGKRVRTRSGLTRDTGGISFRASPRTHLHTICAAHYVRVCILRAFPRTCMTHARASGLMEVTMRIGSKTRKMASICDFACILATTLPDSCSALEMRLMMILLMAISIIIHLSPSSGRKA